MKSPVGRIKLPTVIAVTLGLGLGASMFLNYQQHQNAAQDKKLFQGQIVDLRYQVNQDRLANASPSPSPSSDDLADIPTDSPSPSASPDSSAVLGDSTQATPSPAATSQTATLSMAANLRSAAKSTAGLVARVPKGATASLVDAAVTNKYKHVTINGKTGYILASALQ